MQSYVTEMNKPSFEELFEQPSQTTDLDFLPEKENDTTTSYDISEVMQSSHLSVHIGRLPSLSPVLIGYNYKVSTSNKNTRDGLMVAENGSENKIKELWSAEELTENLVNKTAMRIANLKQKLDEQLKNIKMLQEDEDKCRNCLKSIQEPNKTDLNHHITEQELGLSNNTRKALTVKKEHKVEKQENNVKDIAKTKRSGVIKSNVKQSTVSKIKRRSRRRGIRLKQFFYHPLAMDCSASLPEELTKEEFLRQLCLIPASYFATQNSQEHNTENHLIV